MPTFDDIEITRHAQERYAERQEGKVSKEEIDEFIRDNEDMIKRNILKMLEYAQCLYTGKSFHDNSIVSVYLNNSWVVFVNADKNRVITLYPIDLRAGKELNDAFIRSLITQIESKSDEWNEAKENAQIEIDGIVEEIASLRARIEQSKADIRRFEGEIEGLKSYMGTVRSRVEDYEQPVRELVQILTMRKVF